MSVMRVGRSILAAVVLSLALTGQASASTIIFNTMPTNPASTPETLLGLSIMNVITVGASNVTINGFGTFGRLNHAGSVQ